MNESPSTHLATRYYVRDAKEVSLDNLRGVLSCYCNKVKLYPAYNYMTGERASYLSLLIHHKSVEHKHEFRLNYCVQGKLVELHETQRKAQSYIQKENIECLVIKHLHPGVTEEELYREFEKFGKIEILALSYSSNTGQHSGSAILLYEDRMSNELAKRDSLMINSYGIILESQSHQKEVFLEFANKLEKKKTSSSLRQISSVDGSTPRLKVLTSSVESAHISTDSSQNCIEQLKKKPLLHFQGKLLEFDITFSLKPASTLQVSRRLFTALKYTYKQCLDLKSGEACKFIKFERFGNHFEDKCREIEVNLNTVKNNAKSMQKFIEDMQ